MDFFVHQEKARRATGFLVALYVLAVLATVGSIFVLVVFVASFASDDSHAYVVSVLQNPELILWSVAIPLFIIIIGTLCKILQLNGGGPSVAESVGGREVFANTRDFKERRLLNVVEEMAIAAGIRIPHVYVLDNEPGINAFAAGYSSKDAAVAVTRGTLDSLNREELQGVIGHEFSHILNGDMRLNIWLIGILGGILCIAVIGTWMVRGGSELLRYPRIRTRNSKDNTAALALALLAFGAAVWVIGSLGHFFGRLIQCAVSRSRESLADASSVQFTRNPLGLANALKLIGANARHGLIGAADASEISHMFFVSGVDGLFDTHPPLDERIRLLDPSFSGSYREAVNLLCSRRMASHCAPDVSEVASESLLHNSLLSTFSNPGGARARPVPVACDFSALAEPDPAETCLYAILLSADSAVRSRQISMLGDAFLGGDTWFRAVSMWPLSERRTVAELAFSTLRAVSAARRNMIAERIDALSRADGRIDSFEFALGRMMRRRMLAVLDDGRRVAPASALQAEMRTALSALAWFGGRTGTGAFHAFETGWRILNNPDAAVPGMLQEPDSAAFDAALDRLAMLPPLAKRDFLAACSAVVQDDGFISDDEKNILAAIADSLGADGWGAAQ